MKKMISESDWKKFKKIKEAALERFCETVLNDVSEGLTNKENTTNHGKYLYLYRLIDNYDRQIELLFNDHSRSKAAIQLIMLRGEGLVKEEELENLSDEFKEHTKPDKYA